MQVLYLDRLLLVDLAITALAIEAWDPDYQCSFGGDNYFYEPR